MSAPSFRTGRGRPRRRGRRVTRIVRRIELWSVLKIALVFNTIMLGVALGSVALLWALANTTGLVDDLEGFLRDAGFEDFRFQGERMFEQVAFIGAVGALAATVFMVLATALLNLIAEITGGIKFVVIEEIVDPPRSPAQPPAPRSRPTVPPAPPASAPSPSPRRAASPASAPAPPPPKAASRRGDGDDHAPTSRTASTRPGPATRPAKKAAPRSVAAKKAAPGPAVAKPAPAPRSGGDRATSSGGRRVRRQEETSAAGSATDDDASPEPTPS